ncbi:response regulator [Pseudogemmobacter blasticus]|uniref:Two-component system response regulator n=1 Tax=Fuscovulum blasticum DSM 2131 TaxID=1188250 RepID=A0A2T4J585_FUSBL|nr:response regulator [Fuscovulum blasticum]PTE13059.1 two-component system response regulator [Fuscovulum blasticum DSM 2131]
MTLRVLAIDDSRTIRNLLRRAMEEAGFACTTAEDGAAGVACFAEVDPDVVITDINMPRLDGFGVIDAIRSQSHNPTVPILVLTTESADALKARARQAGATGWIVKPFEDAAIVSVVRKVTGARG